MKDLWLPPGWQEVEPVGHENDKPKENDDDQKHEGPRHELKRWQRGWRYVRLLQRDDNGRFQVTGNGPSKYREDRIRSYESEAYALTFIQKIMRVGGI